MGTAILLLDLANVTIPLRKAGEEFDPVSTINNFRELQEVETILGLWAFGDYSLSVVNKNFQRSLRSSGFQLIQCPWVNNSSSEGKDTDDDELRDQAEWLLRSNIAFDTVYLASGDGHFMRVIQRFRNAGKGVVLVDPDLLCASRDLRASANGEVNIICCIR